MIARIILIELARLAFTQAKKRVVDVIVGRKNKTSEERIVELEHKLQSIEKRVDQLDGSTIYSSRNWS